MQGAKAALSVLEAEVRELMVSDDKHSADHYEDALRALERRQAKKKQMQRMSLLRPNPVPKRKLELLLWEAVRNQANPLQALSDLISKVRLALDDAFDFPPVAPAPPAPPAPQSMGSDGYGTRPIPQVMPCHVIKCHVMSCLFCHVLSCHVLPYHAISYHGMSCLVVMPVQ